MNGMTFEEQKEELKEVFNEDGMTDVFRNVGSANGWLGENDDDDFATAKEKVEKILATI